MDSPAQPALALMAVDVCTECLRAGGALEGRAEAGDGNGMNRSMPASVVIPVLEYPDVRAAVDWLCRAFGFHERLRIASHRAQLTFGAGALVVAGGAGPAPAGSVMVCVAEVARHHEHALAAGAKIVAAPADYPYGERQYDAEDPWGHRWTFSQTIADVDPRDWGGQLLA
jgi:uncharacterized glyoxalase superfamily protein PhnB